MRNEAVATVAREEAAEASRSSQQQGIGGLLCEYLDIMKEQQQESMKKGKNSSDSNSSSPSCGEGMEPLKTEESPDELVRQPESSKIDNPVYRGCSTKIDNDFGLESFPEIELFDSQSN